MKSIYALVFLSILISSIDIKAQNTNTRDSILLISAKENFENYKVKAYTYREQLRSLDSSYKAGEALHAESEENYQRAKKAFKSLEINYKAQLLPYKKDARSRDRAKSAEARKTISLIKSRFQENGKEAAQYANDANREMTRALKIMERAKARADLIIPRLDKTLIEMDKWSALITELEGEQTH